MPERAIVLDPQPCHWTAGAPSPVVLSSEQRTYVVFNQPDDRVAALELVSCLLVSTGFPNDEVLHGHRLWGHGLDFYKVHEVEDSQWLSDARAIERHHHMSPGVPFGNVRHFVLTFHDSTLEALATELRHHQTYESSASAIVDLTEQLTG